MTIGGHHLGVRGKPNKAIQAGTSRMLLGEMVTVAKLKEPPNQEVSRGAQPKCSQLQHGVYCLGEKGLQRERFLNGGS